MDDKVISFPGAQAPRDGLPTTMEEARTRVEAVKQFYIDEVAGTVAEVLTNQVMASGFSVLDDEYRKDFAFLIESIRSMLCSASGLYHPFQDVAENVMKETDQEGVLQIAEEVSVKFLDNDKSDDEPSADASP